MKLIKKMMEQIHDEIEDAEDYAKDALEYKDSPQHKDAADLYYTLANEELGHSEKLKAHVARMVGKHKAERTDDYKEIMYLYEYLNHINTECAVKAKIMLDMYKR